MNDAEMVLIGADWESDPRLFYWIATSGHLAPEQLGHARVPRSLWEEYDALTDRVQEIEELFQRSLLEMSL